MCERGDDCLIIWWSIFRLYSPSLCVTCFHVLYKILTNYLGLFCFACLFSLFLSLFWLGMPQDLNMMALLRGMGSNWTHSKGWERKRCCLVMFVRDRGSYEKISGHNLLGLGQLQRGRRILFNCRSWGMGEHRKLPHWNIQTNMVWIFSSSYSMYHESSCFFSWRGKLWYHLMRSSVPEIKQLDLQ